MTFKNLLKKKKVTQKELASGIGCSTSKISRMARGYETPNSETKARISEYLKCSKGTLTRVLNETKERGY